MLLPVVRLKTRRNSRHPWIFKKMTQAPRGVRLEPGSLVEVQNPDGGFAGQAFYHPENTIALRILSEERGEEVDGEFIEKRLAYAKAFRESVLGLGRFGDSYRLVHAEADRMSGLVVDKFADVILVEPYSAGWLQISDWLVDSLKKLYPDCRVAVRADPRVAAKEGVSFARMEKACPAPDHVDIVENGIRYRVDFRTGHKTGFFLDQRDNRARVAELARGRTVLDLCCYSGGFALSAWKGGAREVTAVDLDEKAVAAAGANAALNGAGGNLRFVHQDAFETMREWSRAGRKADLVVLDPPKLANGQEEVEKALKDYHDLNRAALAVAAEGALFVTCSCSGAVAEERWRRTVRQAAVSAGRSLTIFLNAGPGADHPVLSDFPQGQYLKVMFARVE